MVRDLKKLLSLLLIALLCVSCKGQSNVLEDTTWINPSASDNKISLSFLENGEFYTNLGAEDADNNLSLFDKWKYNKSKKQIELTKAGGEKSTLQVLYLDEHFIALKSKSGVVSLKNQKSKLDTRIDDSAKQYVTDGHDLWIHALSFQNGILTVAPLNYDGDAKAMFEEYICELKVSQNAAFASVSVTKENENTEVEHFELNEKQHSEIGEFYTGGCVKLNAAGEVESMIFYGELIIWS